MAYGLSFETANGHAQIDSETTNTGLIVLASAASATGVTFDPSKEMLFARPSNASYTTETIAIEATGGQGYGASGTYNFVDTEGDPVTVKYIKAKWSNQLTASTSSYGVQVYNSDGDLAYDSGLYTGDGGVGIVTLNTAGTLSGYGLSGGANSRLTTDTPNTKYASMNGSFSDGGQTFFGYEFKRNTGSTTDHGIYWACHIYLNIYGGSQTITIANFTPKFSAEGGSV